MARLTAVLFGAALFTASACGSGTTPPPLVVSDSDSSLTATLGSYCWAIKYSGACGDTGGIITSRQPLVTTGEESISGKLGDEEITDVTVRALPIGGQDGVTSRVLKSGHLVWPNALRSIDLPVTVDGANIHVDISPLSASRYVVSVSLGARGHGSASYGFLLDKQ